MNTETLQKANEINTKIKELNEALSCFEYTYGADSVSTNPRVIIEFDGDGREQIKLPMNLSNEFVDFLKSQIKNGLAQAEADFEAL